MGRFKSTNIRTNYFAYIAALNICLMNKFYIIAVLSLLVSTTYGQISTDLVRLRSELEVIYTDDQKGRRELSNYDSSSQEHYQVHCSLYKATANNSYYQKPVQI